MRLEKWFVRAMLMLALAAPLVAQNLNNLDFLTGLSDYGHLQTMLQDYLNKEAIARLEERRQQIARLSTPEEVSMRRAYLREQMIRVLGGFPAKNPDLESDVPRGVKVCPGRMAASPPRGLTASPTASCRLETVV